MGSEQGLQIALTILGSGALFSFIQFLITRKDTIKKDTVDRKLQELKEEILNDIKKREEEDMESYKKDKDLLIQTGERHQENFERLIQTIEQLKNNDTKVSEAIEKICDKQDIIGQALVGQAHDRLLFVTDRIIERGCITNREKANIDSMYVPYSKLGGNGEVKQAVNFVNTLPVVTEEKARERQFELEKDKFEMINKAIKRDNRKTAAN